MPSVTSVDDLIPPKEAMPAYAGNADFKQSGAEFRETAVGKGLKPGHRVLDLGCGVGRFAVALSEFLDDDGSYVGLDTDRKSIAVCNEWIGSKLPNFSFVWADVFNTKYNPRAEAKAAGYRFPFEDGAFDFVFTNSLFTHLVPDDARHYFHEVGRVLRAGGRTLNTMFLLNEVSLPRAESRTGKRALHEFGEVARVRNPERPEAWIGLDEDFVRQLHAEAGLRIEDVRYGAWSGREASGPGFGRKDIVLALKDT
jgi:ubiquinone/menaquinone biosynthesis C-methylase UbiE